MTEAKLTDVGVVRTLREEYGIQAMTCIGDDPGTPTAKSPTIALQAAVDRGEGYREFLAEQNFEKIEHLGRGIVVYGRRE